MLHSAARLHAKAIGKHTVNGELPAQVRAKYMTLEPAKNRYVAHMRAIRVIQVCPGSCTVIVSLIRRA